MMCSKLELGLGLELEDFPETYICLKYSIAHRRFSRKRCVMMTPGSVMQSEFLIDTQKPLTSSRRRAP